MAQPTLTLLGGFQARLGNGSSLTLATKKSQALLFGHVADPQPTALPRRCRGQSRSVRLAHSAAANLRQAAEDTLAASLRVAITVQLTAELNRVFSEPPVKDMVARVVRDAVGEVLASLDWGNGRPGARFSKR